MLPGSGERRRPSLAAAEQSGDRQQSLGRVPRPAALFTVAGSLVVVLGAFLLVAWITQRAAPRRMAPLRMKCRVSGASAADGPPAGPITGGSAGRNWYWSRHPRKPNLSEVTDPLEVDRLSGLCQQNRPRESRQFSPGVGAVCDGTCIAGFGGDNRVAGDRATGIDQRAVSRERRA